MTPPPIALPFFERGPLADAPENAGAPVLLLHGFGGDARGWVDLQEGLAGLRRTLAVDLPGHGRALGWPRIGGAGVAARAVLGTLDALEIPRAHLVGHSMGGATAALVALKAPERIASLTLLSPGGFGTQINHLLLRRFAAATQAQELHVLFEQFFAWDYELAPLVSRQMAGERARPGVVETLAEIAGAILDGAGQATLPLEDLAALGIPVKLVWGTEDRVLPVDQTRGVPGAFAVHVFPRVGHMPHLEIPEAVQRLVTEQISGR
ncbi:alpha/beta fold hydrolase [Stappia sp. ICDLI1TA098]